MKYIISLFLFFNTSFLFSMAGQNKEALKKIKEVLIKDKNTRTISILPFNNISNNKYYDFIGYTSQKYLFQDLTLLNSIYISTNDIQQPTINSNEIKTNTKIIFNYGTNFIRKVYFLPIKKVNEQFTVYPYSNDLKKFSDVLNSDYLILGNYYILKNDTFRLNVFVYNRIQNKKFKIGKFLIAKDTLEQNIKNVGNKIFKFFNKNNYGYLRVITNISNKTIFIDDNFVENYNVYLLNTGRHKIVVTDENNLRVTREIKIENQRTNYLYITNINKLRGKQVKVKINTNPPNAKVFFNVDYIGNTPVSISNILPGKYRIKISKTNYNDYFGNLKISHSTNLFINLTKSVADNRYKFYKKLTYISLGIGTSSLLTSYYFYAERDIYWDKYLAKRNIDDLNRGNKYSIISGVAFIIGSVGLGISLYSFLKTISYDDKNIGFKIRNKKFYVVNDFINYNIKLIMRF